jgi:hypothetical protein
LASSNSFYDPSPSISRPLCLHLNVYGVDTENPSDHHVTSVLFDRLAKPEPPSSPGAFILDPFTSYTPIPSQRFRRSHRPHSSDLILQSDPSTLDTLPSSSPIHIFPIRFFLLFLPLLVLSLLV